MLAIAELMSFCQLLLVDTEPRSFMIRKGVTQALRTSAQGVSVVLVGKCSGPPHLVTGLRAELGSVVLEGPSCELVNHKMLMGYLGIAPECAAAPHQTLGSASHS
jgi:hypothetical protein